jgi:hypothetical protein
MAQKYEYLSVCEMQQLTPLVRRANVLSTM